MRSVVIALAIMLVAGSTFVFAADWPQFLGPDANGISTEEGINKDWTENPPVALWQVAMHDDGYAGPSAADGRVFIIDHDGKEDVVCAYSLDKGDLLWTYRYADTDRKNYGFARSTPTVDGDRLYVLSRLGLLTCLTVEDGVEVWSRNIMKDFQGRMPGWHLAMSPVVDGDKLIVTPGGPGAAVVALNKNTGELVWKGGGDDPPGYSTPVVATINGQKQYVVFTGHNLIGVDPENGEQLWAFPWQTADNCNAATPIVSGNEIFITTNYGVGCALVRITEDGPEQVWRNKEMQSHFSTPVLWDGYIFGSTNTGRLACLDWETGEKKWETPGFEKGGVLIVDGVLIAVDGQKGNIVMFELTPEKANVLAEMNGLGGQSWTAPIVADGKLIVRNKSALSCYDLK